MKSVPKYVYLNTGVPKEEFEDTDFKELIDVSWSAEEVGDGDLPYVLEMVAHAESKKDEETIGNQDIYIQQLEAIIERANKPLKFDQKRTEAILNGTKTATISNSPRMVGSTFEVEGRVFEVVLCEMVKFDPFPRDSRVPRFNHYEIDNDFAKKNGFGAYR